MFLLARARPLEDENGGNEYVRGPGQAEKPSRRTGDARLVVGLIWSLAVSAVLWVLAFHVVRSLS